MYIRNYATIDRNLYSVLQSLAGSNTLVLLEGVERQGDIFTFAILDQTYTAIGLLLRLTMMGRISGTVKGTRYCLHIKTGEITHILDRSSEREPQPLLPGRTEETRTFFPSTTPRSQPTPMTPPVYHRPNSKGSRNEEIRIAISQGVTPNELAITHNVSVSRIAQIAPLHKYGPK